jgi:competence protein ComEC
LTNNSSFNPFSYVFIEFTLKNEDKTKESAHSPKLEPILQGSDSFGEEYIKDKQTKSVSSQASPADSLVFWSKSLINSLLSFIYLMWHSVKSRVLSCLELPSLWRCAFLERLERHLDARGVPLAQGMLFGDLSGMPQELYQSFKVIGILHILSASSQNFSTFLNFFRSLTRPMWSYLSNLQYFLFSFLIILLYFSLVGGSASTTRAFLSLSLQFMSIHLFRRSNSSLATLGLVAIFMLLINPFYLQTLGFQFSFLASFGILFVYQFLEKDLSILPNPLFKALALSACAQFFLCPIFVYRFQELNYLSLFSNLLVLPLAEMLTVLFLCLFIALFLFDSSMSQILISLISLLISQVIDILFFIINFFEKLPISPWTFAKNKELWTAFFILLNLSLIFFIQVYRAKKYSKNKYRIFR